MQNSISNWETPGGVDINRTKVIGDLTQELHLFINQRLIVVRGAEECYHPQGLPVIVESLEMTLLWTLLFHLGIGCPELFSVLGLIYTAGLKSLTFV